MPPSNALLPGTTTLTQGPYHRPVGDTVYVGLWVSVASGHRVRILTAHLNGVPSAWRVDMRSVSIKQTEPIRDSTIGMLPQADIDREYAGIQFYPVTDAIYSPHDQGGWYMVAIIKGMKAGEHKTTGFGVTYVDLTDGRQGSQTYYTPLVDLIFDPSGANA